MPCPQEASRNASAPVIETVRLVLRIPRPDDAKAMTCLIDDRRIAEEYGAHSASLFA